MQIIPVIDLLNGQVVAAKQGNRHQYRPVQSALCRSSQPLDILQRLFDVYPFSCVYLADLNAIMHNGDHLQLIEIMARRYPDVCFWLDNASLFTDLMAFEYPENVIPVLGSESQDQLLEPQKRTDFILSLDFKGDEKLGPHQLFQSDQTWPEEVILMTLAKVGSNSGPDYELIKHFTLTYPQQSFVASGGVRDGEDLFTLNTLGIQKVLVSSALHNGQLSSEDIFKLT